MFCRVLLRKIFDFARILDFLRFFELWKMPPKRRHFGSSPSENLFLENGASDVNSRTDFPAITVKSTHFLQPADLHSLFIECGGRKCRRFALLLVVATRNIFILAHRRRCEGAVAFMFDLAFWRRTKWRFKTKIWFYQTS